MSQEILDRSDVDLRQQSDDTSVETPDNGEIAAVSVAAVTYKGPLPPPAILQGYKEINPAYADMIMQDFVKNSEHYRNAEMAELEAQIKESRMGQRMAFLLSLALLCIVALSVWLGNITFAGLSGGTFIVLLLVGFLKKNQQR
ncbi:membrane protein, PF10097 family [Selenomonas sp. FOBRC6]|uniref:DUF2335 domain-containing protein n=1 Tax=Selenomonas sp. FOBRC6 TaxID=936572 RepID=UPI00027822DA|nr:DUF2335 domain-containing protein [Selenomonas sp. FOBRC6]EJO23407.1 membrane protein, PF10097 family [Selenomonas sp. FOBRC6]